MLRPLTAFSLVSLATAAAAEPVAIPGSAIKQTVSGALVELDTPADTKIPVRFTDDGLMSGEAGELASFLGAPKDRGRWWVDGEKLCTKWFRWFDAEPHCVSLERDGSRIFWREEGGEKGTATITQQAVQVAEKVTPMFEAGRMPPASAAASTAETPATAPTEVADNGAPTADSASAADAGAATSTPAATPPELPQPTYSLGGENIAKEEAIKDEAIRNQAPVTAEVSQAAPAATAPVATASAEAATPPAAKTETTTADPAKLSFASAAALSAAMPASPNLENIFDPRHRKVPKDAPVQTAKAAAPAQPAASQPAATATIAPPASEIRTAAIPTSRRALPTYRVAGVEDDDILNVRSGPSQYHPQVAAIPPRGRGVEITGPCQDLWCPIRRGRVTGWVNSYYLAADAPGPTALRDYGDR